MISGLWNRMFPQKHDCLCHAKKKTLCDAKEGGQLRVECLCGEESICHRLREMGFCESSVIEKVADSGALICKICDTKVVISKELGDSIIVKDICPCQEHTMNEKNAILLSDMKIGQKGTIRDFITESDDCERIEEMGLTPGEEIEVVRFAPMGDPLEIKIRGYLLSIRRQEAQLIKVVPVN